MHTPSTKNKSTHLKKKCVKLGGWGELKPARAILKKRKLAATAEQEPLLEGMLLQSSVLPSSCFIVGIFNLISIFPALLHYLLLLNFLVLLSQLSERDPFPKSQQSGITFQVFLLMNYTFRTPVSSSPTLAPYIVLRAVGWLAVTDDPFQDMEHKGLEVTCKNHLISCKPLVCYSCRPISGWGSISTICLSKKYQHNHQNSKIKRKSLLAWTCNSFCPGNIYHTKFQLRAGEERVSWCIPIMRRTRFTKGHKLCPLATDIHQ